MTKLLNFCLQSACLAPQRVLGDPGSFYYTPIANDDITWNFEKFLLDQNGQPVRRYTPDSRPLAQMRDDILQLLAEAEQQEQEAEAAKLEVRKPVRADVSVNQAIRPAKRNHRRRQPKHFNLNN